MNPRKSTLKCTPKSIRYSSDDRGTNVCFQGKQPARAGCYCIPGIGTGIGAPLTVKSPFLNAAVIS